MVHWFLSVKLNSIVLILHLSCFLLREKKTFFFYFCWREMKIASYSSNGVHSTDSLRYWKMWQCFSFFSHFKKGGKKSTNKWENSPKKQHFAVVKAWNTNTHIKLLNVETKEGYSFFGSFTSKKKNFFLKYSTEQYFSQWYDLEFWKSLNILIKIIRRNNEKGIKYNV